MGLEKTAFGLTIAVIGFGIYLTIHGKYLSSTPTSFQPLLAILPFAFFGLILLFVFVDGMKETYWRTK